MSNSFLVKGAVTISVALFFSTSLFSQECSVEKDSLKGTYTGDCKNGKANGKGKAVGTDTYDGEFKSGLPDGQGTYTWKNGTSYTGKFTKGLKDGKGNMIFKRTNAPDSLVTGFWKKDNYVGKYEKPYIIHFQSKDITEIEVEVKKGDPFKQITFFVTNTSGGGSTLSGDLPKLSVGDIQMVKGTYGRIMKNNNHAKRTEAILYDLTFPSRMKVSIGSEQIEIEFFEEGSYTLNIRINQ